MTNQTERDKPATGALALAFLFVLFVWGLWIAAAYSVEGVEPGDDGSKFLGVVLLLGLIGCISATIWLASLINYAITGKGFEN